MQSQGPQGFGDFSSHSAGPGALVRYSSFMAGMKNEAGRGGGTRCLADDYLIDLQSIVDDGMTALKATEWKAGDLLALDRKARAVGSVVRMIKLVDGLRPKSGKSQASDNEEQDMSEDETGHGDDMDPAEVAAIRAELESRLNRIRTFVESKRLAGRPVAFGDDGAAGTDAEAA